MSDTTVGLIHDPLTECVQDAAHEAAGYSWWSRRYVFFRPLRLAHCDGERLGCQAFSRDISATRVGLLIRGEVPATDFSLSIPMESQPIELRARVTWTEPCCPGWSLATAQFERTLSWKDVALLLRAVWGDVQRRLHERHPFFRPLTIRAATLDGRDIEAVGKDVSLGGIGFLHEEPCERGLRVLTLPTPRGTADVRADILWSRPCADGLFLSGGQFVGMQFGELRW